ncbi:MAG: hypothetical protein KJ600_03180 [Nanoarchaeota archaeon]|nr:hypothetical protein [Nanoarchaeota archaeon]MBU1103530.1 hypothetical protein [Nanoarchaeota archaeon]
MTGEIPEGLPRAERWESMGFRESTCNLLYRIAVGDNENCSDKNDNI